MNSQHLRTQMARHTRIMLCLSVYACCTSAAAQSFLAAGHPRLTMLSKLLCIAKLRAPDPLGDRAGHESGRPTVHGDAGSFWNQL